MWPFRKNDDDLQSYVVVGRMVGKWSTLDTSINLRAKSFDDAIKRAYSANAWNRKFYVSAVRVA